ncbi:peptidyl-tRNA hydrolase [Candidatus Microgenomates bacterium]|nr:MAG: peptidyl-tRNA hydrolase [Candidatus Microgenomates bacterium]
MKLVVGLGNPDAKHLKNRHNAGHMLVDFMKENFAGQGVVFEKSTEFMNNSGLSVVRLMQKHKVTLGDLYIAHDDLDIPLGEYKIQNNKGPKLHNGIESVEDKLLTPLFWRIRIGIDSRDAENRTPGEQYVLSDFSKDELKVLEGVFVSILKESAMQ